MPAGTVQIPVPVAAAVTIQEVHGNVSFTFWQADGCSSGSVVAQILYQEGNVLAAVFEMVRNGRLVLNTSTVGGLRPATTVRPHFWFGG
jgi:hypothetical protein